MGCSYVGRIPGRAHPGDDGQIHGPRPGGHKCPGAGLAGRAGGHHVVDQQDAAALDAPSAGLGDGEGRFDVQSAPARALAALRVRPFGTDQGVGQIVEAGGSGQGPGDLGGLVEAPRQQPHPVQGHRDDGVGLRDQVGGGAAHPAGEQGGELLLVAVLVLEDQAARRLVIDAGGPGPGEGVGLGEAGGAALRGEFASVEIEGRAAAVADGRLQKNDPAPGVRAEARGRRRLAAVMGERRQDQVGEPAPDIGRGGASGVVDRGTRESARRPRCRPASNPVVPNPHPDRP
jgi:hypothetical protein